MTASADKDKDELAHWLAMLHAPGLGPRTIHELLAQYSSPRELFRVPRQALAGGSLGAATVDFLQQPDWAAVEQDLAWVERTATTVVTCHDERYPPLLRELADAPPLLFVQGDVRLLSEPQLALVGTRNPSAQGAETAKEFARSLAAAGVTITSGLATGVDAAGHRGALAAAGATVAVLGSGLDRVYPAAHRALAEEIATHGALVSEFVPGTPPRSHNFPRRNRLISGLSLGTLVVEAAVHSGSLITARCALEQGREVFAIPGSIHNPVARGCHALIRQGAKLVETVNDILEELGALTQYVMDDRQAAGDQAQARGLSLTRDQQALLDTLGYDPTPMDVLIERSGLTPGEVSSMLLVLELQGYVVTAPGGHICRNAGVRSP